MKYTIPRCALLSTLLFVALTGCKPNKASEPSDKTSTEADSPVYVDKAHNSQNALDWNGTYQGVIPCADCEGIKTSVTLSTSGKFLRARTYLGKEQNVRLDSGTFSWDPSGSVITLQPDKGEPQLYQVGENILVHLDRDGKRITGDLADKYQLMKNKSDTRLENKKWILIALMGQEVSFSEGQQQAFLVFHGENGRISGNNSCNLLNGAYELKEGDRIEFGKMAATLMACPDMTIADQLNQVFDKADNYTIADGVLSLNKARMAPLAQFRLEE